MNTVYIALGSNLGDKKAYLEEAITQLRTLGEVTALSSFYTTEPVGYADQDDFINAVVCLQTLTSPQELIQATLRIEKNMGRIRDAQNKYGPRAIDIDILLYNDEVIEEPSLQIPHPRMHERAFVLTPLVEIAPQVIHPLLKKNISQLLAELEHKTSVEKQ